MPFDRAKYPATVFAITGLGNFVIALGESDEASFAVFSQILHHLQCISSTAFTPLLPNTNNTTAASEKKYVIGSGKHGDAYNTGFENPKLQRLVLLAREEDQGRKITISNSKSSEQAILNLLQTDNSVHALQAPLGENKMPDTLFSLIQGSGALLIGSPHGQHMGYSENGTWMDILRLARLYRKGVVLSDDKEVEPPVKPTVKEAPRPSKRSRHARSLTSGSSIHPLVVERVYFDH